MLAQNFMTAEALGITEKQRDALIKTLALMDSGKLSHTTSYGAYHPQEHGFPGPRAFTGHFNMSEWGYRSDCGTVACIGGTAELLAGERLFSPPNTLIRTHLPPLLQDLFYPAARTLLDSWDEITVEQAAMALRSYLTVGHPHWELALA